MSQGLGMGRPVGSGIILVTNKSNSRLQSFDRVFGFFYYHGYVTSHPSLRLEKIKRFWTKCNALKS